LGRALPQIPLYFVGMPAKALLGVGAVLAGLATLDSALTLGFRGFLVLLERAAQLGR
jgi:flagellar biosynthesis protein FliR